MSENSGDGLPTGQAGISVSVGQASGASANDGDDLSSPLQAAAAPANGEEILTSQASALSSNGDDGADSSSFTPAAVSESGGDENFTSPEIRAASGVSENFGGSVEVSGQPAGASANGEEFPTASSGSVTAVSGNGEDTLTVSPSAGTATGESRNGDESGAGAGAGGTAIGASVNGDDGGASLEGGAAIASSTNGEESAMRADGGAANALSQNGEESLPAGQVDVGAVVTASTGASENGSDGIGAGSGATAGGTSENGNDGITSGISSSANGVSENGGDSTVSVQTSVSSGSSENGADSIAVQIPPALNGLSENGGNAVSVGETGVATGSSENGRDSVNVQIPPAGDASSENGGDSVSAQAPPASNSSSENGSDGITPGSAGDEEEEDDDDGDTTVPPVATSTPPIATSTPPVVTTSTPPVITTSTPPTATSTPPIEGGGGTTPPAPVWGPSVSVGYGGTVDWTQSAPAALRNQVAMAGATSYLIPSPACVRIENYMRIGGNNDPFEVMKVQYFLRFHEQAADVEISGTFDQATFDAVVAFQRKYAADILEPWGAANPTGYVYITTLHKINELLCGTPEALTADEAAILAAYRAGTQGGATGASSATGTVPVSGTTAPSSESAAPVSATSTPSSTPIEVGRAEPQRNAGVLLANVVGTVFGMLGDIVQWIGNLIGALFEWLFRMVGNLFTSIGKFFIQIADFLHWLRSDGLQKSPAMAGLFSVDRAAHAGVVSTHVNLKTHFSDFGRAGAGDARGKTINQWKEEGMEQKLEQQLKLRTSAMQLLAQCPDTAMREVEEWVRKCAATDSTVMIFGETGVGKAVVARAIHEESSRGGQPFALVSCANQNEHLMESELFGHKKGAFTGASMEHCGHFEAANGGSIFLDEVGELPLKLQPRLLRVLEDGTFTRVGSTKVLRSNVRVIAATNRRLEQMVKEETFRSDLFYRLNVFPITVPPLRRRPADIIHFARYFTSLLSRRCGKSVWLGTESELVIQSHAWPGNVREIKNRIERAMVLVGDEGTISPSHLFEAMPLPEPEVAPVAELNQESVTEANRGLLMAQVATLTNRGLSLWQIMGLIVNAVVAVHEGNRSRAARALGINVRTLRNILIGASKRYQKQSE